MDLFAEDGVYNRFTTGIRYEGRDEIRKFVPTHTRAPEKYHKHVLVEPIITLQGDEARVENYWARIDDRNTGPFILSFGRYKDHLVRCPDGKWRFKERLIERDNRIFTECGMADAVAFPSAVTLPRRLTTHPATRTLLR